MRTVVEGDNTFFISSDLDIANYYIPFNSTDVDWPTHARRNVIRGFTRKPLVRELITKWGKAYNLQGGIVIHNHGDLENDEWLLYQDQQPISSTQSWINQMDGKATVLFLHSCNPTDENHPEGSEITSQYSLVLHAAGKIQNLNHARGRTPVRLYIPGEGYVKGSRNLRRIIDHL